MGQSPGGHGGPPADAKSSPLRLVVLLGILAVLAGALGFDFLVANRGATSANEKLEDEIVKLNATGFNPDLTAEEKESLREKRIVNPQKVHEILRRSPTLVETHDDHTVEYYCWWGPLPLLNKRHYLSVVYFGKEPNLRYNTHYQNTKPPPESLPGYQNVGETLSAPGGASAMAGAAGSTPDIPLPGEEGSSPPAENKGKKGKGKGKGGKGKGLPPPGYSSTDEAAPAQPSEGTKEDSASKSDTKEGSPPENKESSPPKGDDAAEGDKPGEKAKEADSPTDSTESKKSDE